MFQGLMVPKSTPAPNRPRINPGEPQINPESTPARFRIDPDLQDIFGPLGAMDEASTHDVKMHGFKSHCACAQAPRSLHMLRSGHVGHGQDKYIADLQLLRHALLDTHLVRCVALALLDGLAIYVLDLQLNCGRISPRACLQLRRRNS